MWLATVNELAFGKGGGDINYLLLKKKTVNVRNYSYLCILLCGDTKYLTFYI